MSPRPRTHGTRPALYLPPPAALLSGTEPQAVARITPQAIHALDPFAARALTDRNLLWVNKQGFRSHVRWIGGPGTGKSLGISRTIVWPLFYAFGEPVIVWDPTGKICADVISLLAALPDAIQDQLLPWVDYIDMAATDYIVPLPLYEQCYEGETLYASANRFIDVTARMDPDLASASIEGLNMVKTLGGYAGMVAVALGLQLPAVESLIRQPKLWEARLVEAVASQPQLAPAVDFFRTYWQRLDEPQRNRRAGSTYTKLMPFLADPLLQARYCSPVPGYDWARALHQKRLVLVDFGGETDPFRRQFGMVWIFLQVLEELKHRGVAGHDDPCVLVIDEVLALVGPRIQDQSLLGYDLQELVSVWARNVGCQLCVAHQDLSSLSPEVNHALLQIGTPIVGNVQNPEDADQLARLLAFYNPHKIRKTVPVWMNVQHGSGFSSYSQPEVIDVTTEEYTPEQQFLLAADAIRRLPKFEFLVKAAQGEGNLTGTVRRVNLERIINDRFPDAETVADGRRKLRKLCGHPLADLQAAIARQKQETITVQTPPAKPKQPKAPAKPSPRHGTLKPGDAAHAPNDSLPGTSTPAEPAPKATGYRSRWQKTESP